jgi:hypothetical protein
MLKGKTIKKTMNEKGERHDKPKDIKDNWSGPPRNLS